MSNWHYKVTVHEPEDILENLSQTVDEVPPTIYCDDEGACYFDRGPNPFTQAIEHLLNEIGGEGWELVQIMFRPNQMIGFWKQPR
ncbi:MAG: DUF4177 domain-containing protein [Anaerolineae bacterium]|jgi:hypothetical protein